MGILVLFWALLRFPASWKLLIVLPSFGFCFDYLCTTSICILWDLFHCPTLWAILSKPCIISPVTKLGRQNRGDLDYSSISAIDVHGVGWKIYSGIRRWVSDSRPWKYSDTVPVCLRNNWTYGPRLRWHTKSLSWTKLLLFNPFFYSEIFYRNSEDLTRSSGYYFVSFIVFHPTGRVSSVCH